MMEPRATSCRWQRGVLFRAVAYGGEPDGTSAPCALPGGQKETKTSAGFHPDLPPLSASQQILRDTGVFEHTWPELELWLEHLDDTAEESKEAVIRFLERVSACLLCRGALREIHSVTPSVFKVFLRRLGGLSSWLTA